MFFFPSFSPQGIRKALPFLLFLLIVQETVSPPVTQKKGIEDNEVDDKNDEEQVSSELHSCLVTSTAFISGDNEV
jgi:hypothetical protein